MIWRLARLLLALGLVTPVSVAAGTVEVSAGGGALEQALHSAEAGDILRLGPGRHTGGIEIAKPLTLMCRKGAEIDGGGQGSVLTVTARAVEIRNRLILGRAMITRTSTAACACSRAPMTRGLSATG